MKKVVKSSSEIVNVLKELNNGKRVNVDYYDTYQTKKYGKVYRLKFVLSNENYELGKKFVEKLKELNYDNVEVKFCKVASRWFYASESYNLIVLIRNWKSKK